MKMSGGISDRGIPAGNTYDKYHSRNPLVRRIMRGFEICLEELVQMAGPSSIHEIGCGEGYWVIRWQRQGLAARGSDLSGAVVDLAQENARELGIPEALFERKSIYDLEAARDGADLIVCCEVLEHLAHPERALRVLERLVRGHVIFSVPREPLWKLLNLARGKYLSRCGNTPGHVQAWSRREFVGLVSRYFEVLEVRTPLPWTMLLCGPARHDGSGADTGALS